MKRFLSCMLALTMALGMMTPVSLSEDLIPEEEITLSEIEEEAQDVSGEAEEAAVPEARLCYEDGVLTASFDGEAEWYFQRVNADTFAALDAETLEAEWTNVESDGARLIPEGGYAYRAIAETADGLFVSDPVVIEAAEPEEKGSDSIITYAEQITANSAKLVWQAVDGAKSYAVENLAAGKTTVTVTTKTTLTFTKLAQGSYDFTVTPCSDKKGKVPMSDGETVSVEVGDWSWAAAPTVTAAVPDTSEAVVTVSWTPAAEGADGFEVSDNKKTVIENMSDETLTFATTNGSKTFYVRPYVCAADGSKIYGTYSKAAKVTISIAWMKSKPVITAIEQTDESEVRLTWKAIDGAEGYRVYEYVNKTYTLLGEAWGLAYTVTGVSYGKHSYAVVAVCENSLGTMCEGTYSAGKAITTKVLWSQAPALSASQYSDTQALLTWSGNASRYKVYAVDGKTPILLDTVCGTRYLTDADAYPLVSGKSYKFYVTPVKDDVSGTASKTVTLKMADGWKIAPVLSAYQSAEDSVTLSWRVAGMADYYNIYQVTGKKTALFDTAYDLSYTVSDLAEGSYTFLVEPVKVVNKKVTKGTKSAAVTVTVETCPVPPYVERETVTEIEDDDTWHLRVYGDGSVTREKHDYDAFGCCDACGHECTHKNMTTEAKQDNYRRTEISGNDAIHTLTYDKWDAEKCPDCGYDSETDGGVIKIACTEDEAHTYVNGVCSGCGHVCGHSQTTAKTENRNYVRTEIAADDANHTLTYDVYTVTTCDKCGNVSEEKTNTVTIDEAHTYDADDEVCTVCGHERVNCLHKQTTTATENRNYVRAETANDDANHTLTYEVWTVVTCDKCGAKISEAKTNSVTTTEAHTYDADDEVCTVCHHERVNCLHKNTTTTTENRNYARSEIANDDANHTLTYEVWTVVTCDKCGKTISETKTDTVTTTETHTYDADGEVCTVCGHERVNCLHKNTTTTTENRNYARSAIADDDANHTLTYDVYTVETCSKCGAKISEEKTNTVTTTEAHTYDADGEVCTVCRHERVNCLHKQTTTATENRNYVRAETANDDANHTLTYEVWTVVTCDKCGAKISEAKTNSVTTTEAHTYDADGEVCTVCGHKRVNCLHKNSTTTTENRNYARSAIADDDANHTLTYEVWTVVTCDKCGKTISETKTDTVTAAEAHTYVNDVCSVCGHEKSAAVISAAFEHCHVQADTAAAITVTTSANAGYLYMYNEDEELLSVWTAAESAAETADGLVWNVSYTFTEPGAHTMGFAASVGGARVSAEVTAEVTVVTAGPAITSVTPESAAVYTGNAVTFTVTTAADAETLLVRDADGNELQSLPADTGSEDGVWTVSLSFTEAGTYDVSFAAAYDGIYGDAVSRTVTVTDSLFTWTEIDGGVRVTGYTGSAASVTVPEMLGGQTVIEIGDGAFRNNDTITSIDLPDTVRKIGANAFANCSALREMK